jgi:hypothetical protein
MDEKSTVRTCSVSTGDSPDKFRRWVAAWTVVGERSCRRECHTLSLLIVDCEAAKSAKDPLELDERQITAGNDRDGETKREGDWELKILLFECRLAWCTSREDYYKVVSVFEAERFSLACVCM